MRISAVIPFKDDAAWIGRALASVAAQSRPADEVIAVDDGSADGSADLARAAGATVVGGPRLGAAAARNAGVDAASGDWVAFLDADDLWYADHLSRAVDLIDAGGGRDAGLLNHFDHVAADVSPDADDAIRPRPPAARAPAGGAGPWANLDGGQFVRWYARSLVFPGMTACCVRRPAWREIGGMQVDQRRRHDVEMFLRLVAGGRTWAYDPRATGAYRSGRPGNLSADLAARELDHLRAVSRNVGLWRHEPAYAGLLRQAARRAMGAALSDGDADARRRAAGAAAPHLSPAGRLAARAAVALPPLAPLAGAAVRLRRRLRR